MIYTNIYKIMFILSIFLVVVSCEAESECEKRCNELMDCLIENEQDEIVKQDYEQQICSDNCKDKKYNDGTLECIANGSNCENKINCTLER